MMSKAPKPAVSCVDCNNHVATTAKAPGNKGATLHTCRGIRDRVTGTTTLTSCHTAAGKHGLCGPRGLLFVAKQMEAAE